MYIYNDFVVVVVLLLLLFVCLFVVLFCFPSKFNVSVYSPGDSFFASEECKQLVHNMIYPRMSTEFMDVRSESIWDLPRLDESLIRSKSKIIKNNKIKIKIIIQEQLQKAQNTPPPPHPTHPPPPKKKTNKKNNNKQANKETKKQLMGLCWMCCWILDERLAVFRWDGRCEIGQWWVCGLWNESGESMGCKMDQWWVAGFWNRSGVNQRNVKRIGGRRMGFGKWIIGESRGCGIGRWWVDGMRTGSVKSRYWGGSTKINMVQCYTLPPRSPTTITITTIATTTWWYLCQMTLH